MKLNENIESLRNEVKKWSFLPENSTNSGSHQPIGLKCVQISQDLLNNCHSSPSIDIIPEDSMKILIYILSSAVKMSEV